MVHNSPRHLDKTRDKMAVYFKKITAMKLHMNRSYLDTVMMEVSTWTKAARSVVLVCR